MLVPKQLAALVLLIFLRSVAAYPQDRPSHTFTAPPESRAQELPSSVIHPRDRNNTLAIRGGSFYLRILPLGASITYGYMSSDGNGYRKALRDRLRFDGWNVNMVGSRSGGTMNDRDVEGWEGYRIDQVDVRARAVVPLYKPNLVLINAGTNDATQGYYVDSTGDRLRAMINYIFDTVPNTCVVLSTLLPNTLNPGNVALINSQYRALAQDLIANGKRLILVEFDNGWLTTADLVDTTHPTDFGYRKMAAQWFQAIGEAESKGWLSAPSNDVAFSDAAGATTTCDKQFGSGNADPRGRTQVLKALSPRVIDDGQYAHSSQSMGTIHSGWYAGDDTVWFAQLVNNGADRGGARDDWVFSLGAGAIYYRENLGGGTFGDKTLIPSLNTSTCKQANIRWGDVNNDGLDDFICLGDEGNMYVWINRGSKPPVFSDVGLYKTAPGGYAMTNVRLGDIDGDGRLDYCVVNGGNGNIYCWRNGGVGDMAAYWQDVGEGQPVFTGKGMGDITGVHLVDINGDFRSDWLWLDDTGKITTYINQRGQTKGLIPNWDSVGVTHAGMGEAGARPQIRFARLYDSGRADYVYVKCMTLVNGRCDYEVRAWKNLGGGGAHQKGDGARWCDMSGTGNDDYVFIDHNSKITIFRNSNTPPNTDYSGWWDKGVVLDLGGINRKAIHLGDWNGDGFCDVIITDAATGALDVYYTYWDRASDQFSFSAKTRVVNAGCTQGWGVGLYDLGIQFADIDGDKRVDYMCLEPDGRVTGWLNKPGGLQWMNQIKFSVGKDRANHRWADVNGDGRDDFMWIDKFTGDADVWYNMGPQEISGSSFWWDPQGRKYQGSSSGPNLHFPNLGGQGRADMTEVNPKTALGWTWFNSCPPGGDDGDIVDPGLPIPPGSSGGGGGGGNDGGGGSSGGDGTDWGSGDTSGSGIIYVDGDVWSKDSPTIGCIAPCTYLFPPLALATPVTVTWPPYETGLWVRSGDTYTSSQTIVSVPPFVVSEVSWWPVTVNAGDASDVWIHPVPSVMPPGTSLNLPADRATMSIFATTGAGGEITYRPAAPTAWGGSFPVQPQPTVPVSLPEFSPTATPTTSSTTWVLPPPIITAPSKSFKHSGGKETGGSRSCGSHCGSRSCGFFGCGGGCGLFGCGGGCGLFGCNGGGCGLLGCGGKGWSNNGCGPAGCGCGFGCAGGGSNGRGAGPCNGPTCDNGPDECSGSGCECEATKTVRSCDVLCTETLRYTSTVTGTCSTIACATTSCGKDTTSTRTTVTSIAVYATLTVVAADVVGPADLSAAYVTDIYNSVNGWLNAEDAYEATACAAAPTPWPTNDVMTWGDAYCFDLNSAPPCADYTQWQMGWNHRDALVSAFCGQISGLDTPGNGTQGVGYALAVPDAFDAFVDVSWADDQTGCGTPQRIDFSQGQWAEEGCLNAFNLPYLCSNGSLNYPNSYGGGYVVKHPRDAKGCLLIKLWAEHHGSAVQGRSAGTTTEAFVHATGHSISVFANGTVVKGADEIVPVALPVPSLEPRGGT